MADIEFVVPDELVGGTYANVVRSNHNGVMFTVDFAVHDDRIANTVRAVARIRLDPTVVQQLLAILSRQMNEFEGFTSD